MPRRQAHAQSDELLQMAFAESEMNNHAIKSWDVMSQSERALAQ
jgi:hypothetical protein